MVMPVRGHDRFGKFVGNPDLIRRVRDVGKELGEWTCLLRRRVMSETRRKLRTRASWRSGRGGL